MNNVKSYLALFYYNLLFFSICFFIIPVCFATAGEKIYYSVSEYGAIGDGTTLNTTAIQTAIDVCSDAGGGTVLFTKGTYLTGTIKLRNNVTLYLDAGSILLGSTRLEDYPVTICDFRSYTDNYTVRSLIYVEKANNVAITGRGIIDGQGAAFKDKRTADEPYKMRPYLIRMIECGNVTVRDVTILNSPMWVQHYLACENVVIDGITVNSFVAGNNDGIDIDSCSGVRISNCDINSGDDAIVLKATSGRVCRDVVVSNCVLRSYCNAYKLGTESNGGFENIIFSNSTIYDTRLAAIALEMVDGAKLERVIVNNIVINNAGTAIFLRLGNRARPYSARGHWDPDAFIPESGVTRPGVGTFRDVVVSNIMATGIGITGCSITGIPGHLLRDITLENIRIIFDGGGTTEMVNRSVPEKENSYPEFNGFGSLPCYGIYTRHAKNITFNNIKLLYEKEDLRPALVFDDVSNLNLFQFDAELSAEAKALVWMKKVNGALVHGCRPSLKINTFAQLDKCENITIMNNDFSNVEKIINSNHTSGKSLFKQNNNK